MAKYVRRTYYSGYNHKPVSVYMAEKHIAAAQKLEAELGSSVNDVKEFLFSLSEEQLKPILREYERIILLEEKEQKNNGAKSATAYARKTLARWKNGEVEMSGLVAERFFKILPNFMPLEIKYNLVDKLCNHLDEINYTPKIKEFYIGYDCDINNLIHTIKDFFEKNIENSEFPKELERRFDWLSQNDIHVKKQLIDYFKDKKKNIEINELKSTLVTLMNSYHSHTGRYINNLEHSLTINKITVNIIFHKKAKGIMEVKPKSFFERIFG